MFEIADNLEIPLTPLTCAIIAQTYSPAIAYIIILRRARNLCWLDWHKQDHTMSQRIGHRLGYRLCQKAITQAISKAVDESSSRRTEPGTPKSAKSRKEPT